MLPPGADRTEQAARSARVRKMFSTMFSALAGEIAVRNAFFAVRTGAAKRSLSRDELRLLVQQAVNNAFTATKLNVAAEEDV